ncbi:MBL fold metallo-hydrolase [Zavarzinia sp. CC-PAN008]|uniref:MBL fold metallo-hydrolase n=1 Tax=Zavarzinia sp. CC-PAN008 TaxID=3243332 RepID=UPI003F7458F3
MAEFMTWRIGDVTVTRVMEFEPWLIEPGALFAKARAPDVQRHPWMVPHFADAEGSILLSFHAFIVESAGRRVIVDTCVGNDKPRLGGVFENLKTGFLEALTDAGIPPETIDIVLCTHMHVDHVGWNTRLVDGQWVPTFPNARYLFAREEYEHWAVTPDVHHGDVFGDSVAPIVAAGLHDLVEPGFRPTPELELEATPGHTPGHVSIRIRSQGAEAVITGDMIHHPLQIAEPEHCTHFCSDAPRAVETRRRFLKEQEGRPILVLGTHFAGPTAGHIVADGDGYRLDVAAEAVS